MKFVIMSLKAYLAERLWLRPAAFGIMAVLTVIVAIGVDRWIKLPFDFSIREQTIRSPVSYTHLTLPTKRIV